MSGNDSMRLAQLVEPLSVARFREEFWEKRSLHLVGEADRFKGLFSSADVGSLLSYQRPKAPEGILLVKGSQHYAARWTEADGSPRLDMVRAAWREGYTLVVNNLGKLWGPVARFAAALQVDLHHPVQVNLYYTPPGSQAFEHHFDVMDVFVLQLEGKKVWQVREAAATLPFPEEHTPIPQDRLPPLVLEEELCEGGMLYMPRGHVHAARTAGTASLHLTFGIHVVTWMDLMAAAVSAVRGDSRFRYALPPGFFTRPDDLAARFQELAADLAGHLDLGHALASLADRSIVGKPLPPSQDDFLAEESEPDEDTVLTRRPGVLCRSLGGNGSGYAGIQYTGGKIMGPEKIGPALRHIAENRSFTVADLGGDLNQREKLVLVRRLVRDGLLSVQGSDTEAGQ